MVFDRRCPRQPLHHDTRMSPAPNQTNKSDGLHPPLTHPCGPLTRSFLMVLERHHFQPFPFFSSSGSSSPSTGGAEGVLPSASKKASREARFARSSR